MLRNKICEYMRSIYDLLQEGSEYLIREQNFGVLKIEKGERDYALDTDVNLENIYREKLMKLYPDIPVLGEELTPDIVSANYEGLYWTIDPIDGTVNYYRGLPEYGSSIALMENGRPIVSGMCFPRLDETYIAGIGMGAFLNNEKISVSNVSDLKSTMLAFGDFSITGDYMTLNVDKFKYITGFANKVLRVRMPGTAALQLAWLASGKIDVSLTLDNNVWDVQGGVLLVREAGGLVYDWDGSEHSTMSKYTIASNKEIKQEVLNLISTL